MRTIKKYIHIVGVAATLFALASCNDYLDTPPVNSLTSDGFYQTAAQCEQGVLGVYADLRYIANDEYLYLSECRSDNAWVEPLTNGLREYSELGTFRAATDLETFNDVWNEWYKVIYDANVAIAKIPKCDFGKNTAIQNQFLGEVYFLRGWAYFELSRLYGNIPIIDTPMSPSEVDNVSQSTAKEVLDKMVIPDLTKAISNLPVGTSMKDNVGTSIAKKGRADKIAAQSMLARVYMTMSGYPFNDTSAQALAETQLKSVIDYSESNNNKYWAPDSTELRKQWMPTDDYYNKYTIFAIQYRSGGTGNTAIFDFSPALPTSYTTIRIFGNSIFVEKTLMHEFDRVFTSTGKKLRDARGLNYGILTGYDAETNYPKYTNATETLTLEDGSTTNVFVNSMFYKFFPTKRKIAALGMSLDIESSMKDYNDWPVNYPILRYEDVLLMYAEVLASKNDISGAMNIVNKIRLRAGCDPETATTGAQALKYVKNERRIELMGEGIRWFDLIRWGEWKSSIVSMFNRYNNPEGTDIGNVKDGRYLCPIPLSQMQARPGLYTQNADY